MNELVRKSFIYLDVEYISLKQFSSSDVMQDFDETRTIKVFHYRVLYPQPTLSIFISPFKLNTLQRQKHFLSVGNGPFCMA